MHDLVLEQWLRHRQYGLIVWETKNGEQIPIKDMTDNHLHNAIKCLAKRNDLEEINNEYEAYIFERMFA